ncbi:hypothetical protein B0O80DRAFT_489769 [Mortierella sp. GBAus27b]|nr:hypothetical protein B0O80DRAFT_489769 [Mortierella sp. GBAus27b]
MFSRRSHRTPTRHDSDRVHIADWSNTARLYRSMTLSWTQLLHNSTPSYQATSTSAVISLCPSPERFTHDEQDTSNS